MVEHILIQGLTYCGAHNRRFRRSQKIFHFPKENTIFFSCLHRSFYRSLKRDGERVIIT